MQLFHLSLYWGAVSLFACAQPQKEKWVYSIAILPPVFAYQLLVIKDISFELGGEIDNLFLLLGTNQNGKALLSCYISKNLVASKNLDAGKIIRELGTYIQGGGGGQPFFATAGGKNPNGLKDAMDAVLEKLN